MQVSYPIRLHVLSLAPLALVLVWLFWQFGSDAAIAGHFAALRPRYPELTKLLGWYTNVGNAAFYLVYACFLVRGLRRSKNEDVRFVLAYLSGQFVASLVLGRILKISIGRPRPMVGGEFVHFALDSGHHSFPSGHTTEIVGAAMPFIQRYRTLFISVFLSLVIALMGFSRIYLGAHYPTDVLGGMVLGSLAGYACWRFAHFYCRHDRRISCLISRLGLGKERA